MADAVQAPELHDLEPSEEAAQRDVLAGLRTTPKRLSPKFFYDEIGSKLFDQICVQPEYYPTRTELDILQEQGADIARAIGPGAMVIEPGSGSSTKIRLLLDALKSPSAYVPVEISKAHLENAAAAINVAYPTLEVLPVCADFTRPFALPDPSQAPSTRVLFFPGSTIGNFEPSFAAALLGQWRSLLQAGEKMLIGVDLVKDTAVLESAYNDANGITAQFNRNMLVHLNKLVGANFQVDAFTHRAFFNAAASRIEMHLVCGRAHSVTVGGERFDIADGESIHTESSVKYTLESFAAMARKSGCAVEKVWTDPKGWFSVQLLRAD